MTATLAPATLSSVSDAQPQVTEVPEITFVRPIPGFESLTRFALVTLGGADEPPVVYELRSLDQPDVRFLVGVPGAFFPEYEVELDDEAVMAKLGRKRDSPGTLA